MTTRSTICLTVKCHIFFSQTKPFDNPQPKYCQNMCCSYDSDDQMLSWTVMTCERLQPDWTFRIKITVETIFRKFQLWAQRPLLKFVTLGKFDWGVRYVIIFLYEQFWIRLGTVSYRGKKVRTADFPAVRSVNKSRDTRNYVQNEPNYAICVLFAIPLYY